MPAGSLQRMTQYIFQMGEWSSRLRPSSTKLTQPLWEQTVDTSVSQCVVCVDCPNTKLETRNLNTFKLDGKIFC